MSTYMATRSRANGKPLDAPRYLTGMEWVRRRVRAAYERLLHREIDGAPSHVAVIQDGNRRYAREHGDDPSDGHRAGAETTREMLRWCADLGVAELTLYAFSTENFERPRPEREHLFDLLEEKLREFADEPDIHEEGVTIRAIGDLERLPPRVREAVDYAERRTADHDTFRLNVALAYGGRNALLAAARDTVEAAAAGRVDPAAVDASVVEDRLPGPDRSVDLIVRTGGDERTSNFLPWHADGNEAAVFFCAPYWPAFSKTDFLRAVRTYQSREKSWRQTRARRALALLGAASEAELADARAVLDRFRGSLPAGERADTPRDDDPDPAAAD
jgi:tritrans,polycis-undecaprenyl-diphosphate synthase [geranylgeranyl-diphosphate specific]